MIVEGGEIVTVETVQALGGAEPHEADPVLADGVNGPCRQSVLDGNVANCELVSVVEETAREKATEDEDWRRGSIMRAVRGIEVTDETSGKLSAVIFPVGERWWTCGSYLTAQPPPPCFSM